MPKLETNNEIEDIDPFTVFALFNKGISNDNRIRILTAIANIFNIRTDVPVTFDGIPVVNNLGAAFYSFKEGKGDNDIDNLWELFYHAIQYSATLGEPYKSNLDSRNRNFLSDEDNMPHEFTTIFANVNKGLPDGESYFIMCEQARDALKKAESPYHSFPELSYHAWKYTNEGNPSVDANVKEKRRNQRKNEKHIWNRTFL